MALPYSIFLNEIDLSNNNIDHSSCNEILQIVKKVKTLLISNNNLGRNTCLSIIELSKSLQKEVILNSNFIIL